MKTDALLARADELIKLGDVALTTRYTAGGLEWVEGGAYHEFRSAVLSFLRNVFGDNHPFYREFDTKITSNRSRTVQAGQGMLRAARTEIASGWLRSTKQLLAADIFADFLEMAEYLLQEGYKDPAAVVIGSVLEERLRQSATASGISITIIKDGRSVPRKRTRLIVNSRRRASTVRSIRRMLRRGSTCGIRQRTADTASTRKTK